MTTSSLLHHRDDRVGGAQVDTNNLAHDDLLYPVRSLNFSPELYKYECLGVSSAVGALGSRQTLLSPLSQRRMLVGTGGPDSMVGLAGLAPLGSP
jgi:hypothetical protein